MSMRVDHGLTPRTGTARPAVVTIGNFDGVHLGHRALLERTVAAARQAGGEAVVVTFRPHPRCVLDPGRCPPALTTLDEKVTLLDDIGVDRVIVLEFTRAMSEMSADRFCAMLAGAVGIGRLVVGAGFALGRGRTGNIGFLRALGAREGFEVEVLEPVLVSGVAASSSLVRETLGAGAVHRAAAMLGRGYFLDAVVVHGDRIGTALGYPTANLSLAPGKCLPANGVYAMWLHAEGRWHMAASSLGVRPTFGGRDVTLEAFLLDFGGDLYERRVRAVFVNRLRDERMYDTAGALRAQIALDVEETRHVLGIAGPPAGLG